MLRPGRTVSGPTLMALADFAMYVVLLSAIGPIGLAVTTNLNINFLRKGEPGQDVLAASLVRRLARPDCACHIDLFHSKQIGFCPVLLHLIYKALFLLV
jgi:acyl-coenzyme A thioesterase PaaI-like protein